MNVQFLVFLVSSASDKFYEKGYVSVRLNMGRITTSMKATDLICTIVFVVFFANTDN